MSVCTVPVNTPSITRHSLLAFPSTKCRGSQRGANRCSSGNVMQIYTLILKYWRLKKRGRFYVCFNVWHISSVLVKQVLHKDDGVMRLTWIPSFPKLWRCNKSTLISIATPWRLVRAQQTSGTCGALDIITLPAQTHAVCFFCVDWLRRAIAKPKR